MSENNSLISKEAIIKKAHELREEIKEKINQKWAEIESTPKESSRHSLLKIEMNELQNALRATLEVSWRLQGVGRVNYKDSVLSELKSSRPCCKGDHLSRVSISLELKERAEKIMNTQACKPKYKFFRRFQGGAT